MGNKQTIFTDEQLDAYQVRDFRFTLFSAMQGSSYSLKRSSWIAYNTEHFATSERFAIEGTNAVVDSRLYLYFITITDMNRDIHMH